MSEIINTHSPEHAPHEAIMPLAGHDERRYSLPEPGRDGKSSDVHFDDWIMTSESADEEGNLFVGLARYHDDGSIENRPGLPIDVFEDYQVKVDAETRFNEAKKDLGASALGGLVREIRNGDKYADRRAAEEQANIDSRRRLREARDESLRRLKDYNDARRRENPMRGLQQGKHHPKRRSLVSSH